MSSSVTVGAMEITASGTSAADMVETLKSDKPDAKQPKALVDRGEPVKQEPEKEGLAKAASELGKKGGVAAAEARAKAAKEAKAAPKPEAKPAEKPEPEAKEPEAKEAKAEEAEPEEKPNEKAESRARARIAELARQRHDAERRAAMAEARVREYEARERPAEPDGPPQREKFGTVEEYAEALADHHIRVKERDAALVRAARERGEQIGDRVKAFNEQIKDDPEFTDKVDVRLLDMKPAFLVQGEVGPENVLAELLVLSDQSRDMFYHLTEHPEEVEKLLKSPSDPEMRRAFGRLEGRVEAARERAKDEPKEEPEPEEPAPTLPPPFKPLKASAAGGGVDITSPNLEFDSFMRAKKGKKA